MGFIKVDHNQAQQGRFLPPEGVYECVIASAVLNTTNGGTEYLKIKLTIRGDVPQAFPGETIEWPVWRKKEPTQNDPDGFPLGTIQHISRVVKFENGQSFETFDEWTKAITGKPIRVEIKHREYNGNTNARVAYVYETEYPTIALEEKGFVPVVVSDEELPF